MSIDIYLLLTPQLARGEDKDIRKQASEEAVLEINTAHSDQPFKRDSNVLIHLSILANTASKVREYCVFMEVCN